MQHTANLMPVRVITQHVPATAVARYYLEVEFSKLFKVDTSEIAEVITKSLQELSENSVWALLEAMSFTYHLNGVFYKVSKENYSWHEEVWQIKDVILTGMDQKANKVIFSEEVNGDPVKFKSYLQNYFKTVGTKDSEGLLSYKPSNKDVRFKKLLMIEEQGKLKMLDGSHRLVEMFLTGSEEITAYVGHPKSETLERTAKARVGNSTFILLTILFKQGTESEKKAVMTVTNQLLKNTTDGKDAVQKFWVDRQRDEEIKSAGLEILSTLQITQQ